MQIVTEHLKLREFTEDDFEAVLAYQSDPRYLRYYAQSWAEHLPENVRKLVERQVAYQHEQPRTAFQLVITLRDKGTLIGNVGVRTSRAEATEGDIGCELAPDYWNQGYATEATGAMLAFGFEHLGLHRLSASTMARNSAAWRVLEKLGMTREGELRETTLLADGWANSLVYGMLRQEWQARADRHEQAEVLTDSTGASRR
jgi:ribosomal-protein-alanine N-acetyltransferase